MSGPPKVVVLDPDARAARQLQIGCTREGIPVTVLEPKADGAPSGDSEDGASVALVGGKDDQAVDLVRRVRWERPDIPIIFVGHGSSREALYAAGADEVLDRPLYLRDAVTIARMLAGVPKDDRDHLVGSLVETTGVFTLVRALAGLGRSAVLTLIRGLRRGEVRFFHGEVTSAQVGLIHGQAALHQLLLWTDARFDFAHEDIVRRQQIPLSADELFADAERFLDSVRESAGGLSPATVLEQDIARVHNLGKQIPTEVHGVLRMFDGHRVLADVLEDSPYRVFETLRVAQRAVEAGLLRPVQGQKPKATWRAVLALEEWLVGNQTRADVVERTAEIDSTPAPNPDQTEKQKKRKTRDLTPAAGVVSTKADIDWGALVPRVIGADVGPLSGVVPAQGAHGEIVSREAPREKLETLDTTARDRIFPKEAGGEPSVVVGAAIEEQAARTRAASAPIAGEEDWTAAVERAKQLADEADKAPAAVDEADKTPAVLDETKPSGPVERMSDEDWTAAVERAKQLAEQADGDPAKRAQEIAKAEAALIAQPIATPASRDSKDPVVSQLVAEVVTKTTEAVTIAETATATVTVADKVTVVSAGDTAVVTSSPTTTITEKPPEQPPETPVDEPAMLVSDLAAVHTAALAAVPPAPPPPTDAASASRELAVAETRTDALAATADEEAFFNRTIDQSGHVAKVAPETFDDLDEGYRPAGFWDRVFGRKPEK